jgi:hypothetical protein
MRIQALAIFAIGTVSIGPAAAQMYDPAYPVCLQVYGRGGTYYDCHYTSLPQCNASASGLSAQRVRRTSKERRSGTDTGSEAEAEKQLVGERRSGSDRRSNPDRRAGVGDKKPVPKQIK